MVSTKGNLSVGLLGKPYLLNLFSIRPVGNLRPVNTIDL